MKKYLLFYLIFGTVVFAQYNGKSFSLGVSGVYTTEAKIFLSPNSSDSYLRNSAFPIVDILNPGISFRYLLTDKIILGLSSEYMEATATGRNLTVFAGTSTSTIEVEDGFLLIPIEFSIIYLMPFSTTDFKFLMSGGIGYYHGSHIRKFGNVEVSNEERKIAYGIHVGISMDYLLRENVIIRSGMKFRDPQFNVTSRYNTQDVLYEGQTIRLAQETFESKINVDGVTFILGIAYQF